jgi:hypothetical protein
MLRMNTTASDGDLESQIQADSCMRDVWLEHVAYYVLAPDPVHANEQMFAVQAKLERIRLLQAGLKDPSTMSPSPVAEAAPGQGLRIETYMHVCLSHVPGQRYFASGHDGCHAPGNAKASWCLRLENQSPYLYILDPLAGVPCRGNREVVATDVWRGWDEWNECVEYGMLCNVGPCCSGFLSPAFLSPKALSPCSFCMPISMCNFGFHQLDCDVRLLNALKCFTKGKCMCKETAFSFAMCLSVSLSFSLSITLFICPCLSILNKYISPLPSPSLFLCLFPSWLYYQLCLCNTYLHVQDFP